MGVAGDYIKDLGSTANMSDVQEATNKLLDVNLHENQRSIQMIESASRSEFEHLRVTIGATVPTGFEQTAADEVREKLRSSCKISKDRGKIYFDISVESLAQVHCLRSVDNLFVVVQEFKDYQFKEIKEEVLKDFEELAGKLPWSDPLKVLLNIHDNEVIVGIALTEESLHRRNITHFGPTTLRSTLAYGMLRLCAPQPTDIIVDPMCGTGAIPIEGATEWSNCFHIAGDNNPLAVNRATNNISSLLTKSQIKEGELSWGLPIDTIQWDSCSLPLRTGSVDVIVTDMPFGKRMGSKKRNWNLYPACLMEMSRVCRPGTGRAALLTQDKKCFIKALSGMGHLWRKVHTVWVNIGGLHAAVYLLKRTPQAFVHPSENDGERNSLPRLHCSKIGAGAEDGSTVSASGARMALATTEHRLLVGCHLDPGRVHVRICLCLPASYFRKI
ncbi:tRNA (guanine(6)-N2)-methyltransferase THUMP3 isoform X4 [Saccopteryx bilineata]|uniref:tRNA (guanine(6)-N2)-methyltransferase THUMP3 isoform X4 n=1 Tax=Saccopteryx bilineata TaxID=59482 RepID=UPI00338F2642